MSYESKYGTYPHNLYLNLATDFGLVITAAVILLGIITFLKMIRLSKKNLKVLAFTLYIFAYLPATMVGRSVYSNIPFFQYGMCVILVWCLFRPGKNNSELLPATAEEHK